MSSSSTPRPKEPVSMYGYAEVAARIEAVLGVRPAESTLRAAATSQDRPWDYPPRITAGMPAPLRPRTSPTRFAAVDVEEWLQAHPWRTQRAALDAIKRAATRSGEQEMRHAVRRARAAGASWTAITDALRAGGRSISRARVYQLYRDIEDL